MPRTHVCPPKYQDRTPYANDFIKSKLALHSQDLYREFYQLIESHMVEIGCVKNTFRSFAEKDTIHKELRGAVILSEGKSAKWVKTLDCIETEEGQKAFRRLVCKIATNVRRRKHQQAKYHPIIRESSSSADESTIQVRAFPTIRAAARNTDIEKPLIQGDGWQNVILITMLDGEVRVLCRLCELTRMWKKRDPNLVGIDDLDYELLVSFLEMDYDFDRHRYRLGWDNKRTTLPARLSSIDNERQWKASVASMLRQRRELCFYILHHDES